MNAFSLDYHLDNKGTEKGTSPVSLNQIEMYDDKRMDYGGEEEEDNFSLKAVDRMEGGDEVKVDSNVHVEISYVCLFYFFTFS